MSEDERTRQSHREPARGTVARFLSPPQAAPDALPGRTKESHMTTNPTDQHDTPFTGQVAVVTGAASGIGEAIAIHLAERGARIAGVDIAPALADPSRPSPARATSR